MIEERALTSAINALGDAQDDLISAVPAGAWLADDMTGDMLTIREARDQVKEIRDKLRAIVGKHAGERARTDDVSHISIPHHARE